jgi:hypothetical protein
VLLRVFAIIFSIIEQALETILIAIFHISIRVDSRLSEALNRFFMAHEIAKLLLEQAETFLDRTKAVETAISLGMPLNEIEEYLDWLDQTQDIRHPPSENTGAEDPSGENPQK